MNPYMTVLSKHLVENMDMEPGLLWELMYNVYRELNPLDSEKIRAVYRDIDRRLDCLSLREADEIWYQICGLCSEHEKDAFLYGVRVGILLGVKGETDCHISVSTGSQ